MQSVVLRFYVSEKQHHHNELMHEWLLRLAQRLEIPGGSAFRAIAGYGKHGRMHEETFFELAGNLAVAVEFILDMKDADRLLAVVVAEKLQLHYVRYAVESGTTGV
jgi:PII-like signaling protein